MNMSMILALYIFISCVHAYNMPHNHGICSRNLLSKYRTTERKNMHLNTISISEALQSTTDAVSTQFVPPEVGPEIYIGTIVSLIPIVWATIEFNSRIQTQRNCLLCKGSGLVSVTRNGNPLTRPRKCWSCGGFLPWLGWKMFFFSTFFDIGNGGPLQRPAKDYNEINEEIRLKMENDKNNNSNTDN